MRAAPLVLVLLLVPLLAACAPAVPDEPSFQQHISPILAANCIRCHGAPPIGGAPARFRLDTYDLHEQPVRGTVELVGGAAVIADAIAATTARETMPPRFPLDAYQVDTLAHWAEAGAPRGAPNAGNRPPTARLDGAVLVVADPDDDIVGGVLRGDGVPLAALRSGPNAISIPPNLNLSLEVVLDDGGVEVTIPLGVSP